ncbi:MAG: hypothetical protein Tp152DCM223801_34 [Prokaryotic dsDNA virus sp.]|nr:MAG: hypothetical protein Tp152DCM223801_34 [Prokaryotic dsDNA virus sp.]
MIHSSIPEYDYSERITFIPSQTGNILQERLELYQNECSDFRAKNIVSATIEWDVVISQMRNHFKNPFIQLQFTCYRLYVVTNIGTKILLPVDKSEFIFPLIDSVERFMDDGDANLSAFPDLCIHSIHYDIDKKYVEIRL